MKYQPYPRYKPSGVEWLGEVPEHWEAGHLRRFAAMKTGHTPSRTEPGYWADCEIPWFTLADVWQLRNGKQIYLGETKERISRMGLANSAAELLPTGTVVFSRTASIGFSGIMPEPMATTQDFWNWVPGPKLISEFLLYQFRAMSQEFTRFTMGSTHKTIYQPDAARLCTCVPPIAEQQAIVTHISRQTAKLDTLVEKKRTLIERLKEKRTALISRTVTRGLPPDAARAVGLDPHPKLKPSNIDWLGDVPEHWLVKPLGRVVRFAGGATPDKGKPEYWDGEIPWVSPKDMKVMRIANVPDHVTQEGLANSALILLPVKSVLIVVRGMILAHSFPVAISDVPVTINQDMKAIEVGTQLEAEFVLWVLTGIAPVFVSLADESAHGTRKLESEVIAKVCLPVPPRDEQVSIIAFLERETSRLDAMVEKIETAIDRLQEYRTALITAAVTGKIDVRGQTPTA
ncbi:restriction endonuclease subunit S [Thiocapsa sp.]|uniref:restriction endonuclease subunit S n=1 Tax=Thiocapsa sp. TaxID=2024551 RepID=UPI00359404EA